MLHPMLYMPSDEFEPLIFAAELSDSEIPVLDVHGYTQNQALYAIEEFLCKEHARGKRHDFMVVKIITGSGSGKLQIALKQLLTQKKLDFIVSSRHQEQPLPSSAVTYVVLAPNI